MSQDRPGASQRHRYVVGSRPPIAGGDAPDTRLTEPQLAERAATITAKRVRCACGWRGRVSMLQGLECPRCGSGEMLEARSR